MTKTPDIAVSDELFAPVSTGVELCYQTFGDSSTDPLLLVMGLSAPMNWWDSDFCKMLASKGFYVIRFDNRDVGRSSSMPGRVSRAHVLRAFAQLSAKAPYSLSDMARDCVALLDHLGIDSAHIAGISMGGMIAQTMAVEHAPRVRSLTSIMSTTGKRTVGWQHPALLPRLLVNRPTSQDAYVEQSIVMSKLIGSPGYPEPRERAEKRAVETWVRGLNGPGVLRQMMAILTQPSRSRALHSVTVPTMVIHGLSDKMVHASGGRNTSASVPGSELLLVDGMGHDLPVELWETVTDSIRRTADRV